MMTGSFVDMGAIMQKIYEYASRPSRNEPTQVNNLGSWIVAGAIDGQGTSS
jgi:hypothetical protein